MTDETLAQIVVLWAESGEAPEDVAIKLHDAGHDWEAVEATILRATELIAEKQTRMMAYLAKRQVGWD